MRYGLAPNMMGMNGDARTLAELASLAEEAGWDGFFLEDYVIHNNPYEAVIYDAWIALTAIAMHTERLRIGALVTPLSRRRPWKLARETVTLDRLSNGRLIVGVGLGDLNDRGFAQVGEVMDGKQRARMLDEGLDVLVGLWSGQPFSYCGEYYQVDEITFVPQPLQSPRIPIWVGGVWPHKGPMRRAARWDGVCPYKVNEDGTFDAMTPADVRALKAFIEAHRVTPAPFDIVQGGWTPGEDLEQARAMVRPFVEAGATWWVEFISPEHGDLDVMRTRIKQGPPRIE
jgi:alkanesulfonate monooxygenase SsuD/methylene tetrahydromethanopterin reductase-like flavin-dependent oxidoreductase (luciferase family)